MTATQVPDMLIVGAGAAGLACSIAAADHGAHVLMIEKTNEIGGTLHIAGGKMSAGGTRRQRERGIEDSPDLHYADVLALSNNTVDSDIVRRVVDEAPATLDWLDDLGFPFDPEAPVLVSSYQAYEAYSVPRLVWGPGPVTAPHMAQQLLKTCEPVWRSHLDAGRIDCRFGHSLVDVLVEDGKAVGVLVDGPEGRLELRAPKVVLATGGYHSNPELFKQLTPGAPRPVAWARPASTGDGLTAGERAGGVIRNQDRYLPGVGTIAESKTSNRALPFYARLSANDRPPREIHVNARGERFRAEDNPSIDHLERALLEQPGHQLWMIFDEAALTAGEPLVRQWTIEEIRERAVAGDYLFVADDLATLAEAAGIDPAGLEKTAQAWNESVRTGVDPLGRVAPAFGLLEPPFYALETHSTPVSSTAGLTIDDQLRVLQKTGTPIENLYAVGEILGSGTTMGFAKVGGMMITPALSLGRALGRALAPSSLPV